MPKFVRIAKVTIKVVDEERKPVKGAKIDIYLYRASPRNKIIKGMTDSEGIFSVSGYSANGVVGGVVEKSDNYYSTFHHDFFVKKMGIWQPWNKEIQVTLRPIINPVPMYVRNQWSFELPVVDKEIGYDLSKSDWVPPYGKGEYPDFIFKVERKYKDISNFDATLILTFPNKYDGIQVVKENPGGDFKVGSRFRLLRRAPEGGYQQKLVKRLSSGASGIIDDAANDDNYVFRVRSEVENGQLKRAMYGKILGKIAFDVRGSKTSSIHMHYYLNPDYTRNLEFDPKRNLFTNLPEGEGVGLP